MKAVSSVTQHALAFLLMYDSCNYFSSSTRIHVITYNSLLDRCLPKPIVLFLLNWYSFQQVFVKWSGSLSAPFTVSNGVQQDGVLSLILFAIYIASILGANNTTSSA